MLTITINLNRVLFVVYSFIAIFIMGFVGSMLIVTVEYSLGTVWAVLITMALLGACVTLIFGLKRDLWNK